MATIPYALIETVFLDAGNTLVSIDFHRVAAALSALGIDCEPVALRRAEAAARPALSRRLFVTRSDGDGDPFHVYLGEIVGNLDGHAADAVRRRESLVAELALALRSGQPASGLWRAVLPGVPGALERLRRLGLQLAVVSNSDGTVEESVQEAGLRPFFFAVIDSAIVGYEKPDPRIFEQALARCGARRETTLHVGDMYHADVEGARRAGLHAVLLDPYDDWGVPDCTRVADLVQLADLFEEARRT